MDEVKKDFFDYLKYLIFRAAPTEETTLEKVALSLAYSVMSTIDGARTHKLVLVPEGSKFDLGADRELYHDLLAETLPQGDDPQTQAVRLFIDHLKTCAKKLGNSQQEYIRQEEIETLRNMALVILLTFDGKMSPLPKYSLAPFDENPNPAKNPIVGNFSNGALTEEFLHFLRRSQDNSKAHWHGAALDATYTEHAQSYSELIEAISNDPTCVDAVCPNSGRTPLINAINSGQTALAHHLINIGADVNIPDNRGCTALHYAAQTNNPKIVEVLIKAGATLDKQETSTGHTALTLAAYAISKESILSLLAAGAKTDIRSDNMGTAQEIIKYRIKNGNLSADKLKEARSCLTILQNAEPALVPNQWHRMALLAIHMDEQKCFAMLKQAITSDVTSRDANGTEPALMLALRSDARNNARKILLECGADINQPDKAGFTSAHVAAERNMYYTLGDLIGRGVEIDRQANDGTTPLIAAAGNGSAETTIILLTAEARIDLTCESSGTALETAKIHYTTLVPGRDSEEVFRNSNSTLQLLEGAERGEKLDPRIAGSLGFSPGTYTNPARSVTPTTGISPNL